jgi:hypothetical protein
LYTLPLLLIFEFLGRVKVAMQLSRIEICNLSSAIVASRKRALLHGFARALKPWDEPNLLGHEALGTV